MKPKAMKATTAYAVVYTDTGEVCKRVAGLYYIFDTKAEARACASPLDHIQRVLITPLPGRKGGQK